MSSGITVIAESLCRRSDRLRSEVAGDGRVLARKRSSGARKNQTQLMSIADEIENTSRALIAKQIANLLCVSEVTIFKQ
jgi:hypothetical protein